MNARPPSFPLFDADSWRPLFPQPVPRRWLAFALLGLLLLARQPHDLLDPQFNAEEGAVFFQEAYNEGFFRSLLNAESGYYHLTLRLTAGLALLVPLELAPLVFKLVALAIQLLPVAYLLADDVAGFVATPLFRVLAAAVSLAGPGTDEIYLNVNNSQWHLTFTACLILLTGPRSGMARRLLDAGVLLLFATSGPLSVFCAPLALWSWRHWRRGGQCRSAGIGPLIVAAGAVVQLVYLLSGSRVIGGPSAHAAPAPAEIIRILGLHGVCNSLLGTHFTARNHAAMPFGIILATLSVLPALAFAAVRLRHLALVVLLGLAGVSMSVVFLFTTNDPRSWLHPNFGPRYFYFSMLFILLTLLVMAERGGGWRLAALPGLAAALAIGIRGDYRIVREPDTRWPEQVAIFRSLPRGVEFFIPVSPQPSPWGLSLRQKHQAANPRPLGGYGFSGETAGVVLDGVHTTLPPGSESPDQFVVFTGHAVGAARGAPPGGVFLLIDGNRLLPAVTGLPVPAAVGAREEHSLPPRGFARFVPKTEIGPGLHSVRVLALGPDRTRFLEAGPGRFFALP